MDFNEFDDHSEEENSGTQSSLASYSDLFATISFVFLFVYIVSIIENGVGLVSQSQEHKKKEKALIKEYYRDDLALVKSKEKMIRSHKEEIEQLKQQYEQQIDQYKKKLALYKNDSKDYLNTEAGQEEKRVYQQMLSKLKEIREIKKEEKDKLYKSYIEEQEKVNQIVAYQEQLENIIESNLALKKRFHEAKEDKDLLLQNLDMHKELVTQDLERKAQEKLNEKIIEQEQQFRRKLKKQELIALEQQEQNDKQLEKQQQELERMYQEKISSKQKEYERAMEQGQKQLALEKKHQQEQLEATLANYQAEHNVKLREIDLLKQRTIEQLKLTQQKEQAKLEEEFNIERQRKIAQLENEYKIKEDQFEEKQQKLLEKRLANAELEKAKAIERAQLKFNSEYNKAMNELENRKKQLSSALGRKIASVEKKEQELEQLQEVAQKRLARDDLSIQDKKNLINDELINTFSKTQLPVKIDPVTGDLTLSFAHGYFAFDSDVINPAMRDTIKKVVPIYAKIISQKKIKDMIETIEVVGFASPIFNQKYVDPKKLSSGNFKALNYNMDLSYRRARSIYKFIFNPKKMRYPHQKDLFVKTHVAGRSYLEGREVSSSKKQINKNEYCKIHDCDAQRKVMIRYKLKRGN